MNYPIVINDFTIICAALLLIVTLLSALFNPFLRFRKPADSTVMPGDNDSSGNEAQPVDSSSDATATDAVSTDAVSSDAVSSDAVSSDATAIDAPSSSDAPLRLQQEAKDDIPVSIILTPHDETELLETNLPLLLNQDYCADYQVIVVIDQDGHDTEDAIKRIQHQLDEHPGHASLYMTYIPESSRYMSRKKLAITLGVKAARTEWVLLTEAYTAPASTLWLRTMTAHCNDYTQMVIGYGAYADEASSFKRFERLNMAYYLMREDAHGKAYRTQSHNLLMRKSAFMAQEGFRGSLNLIRGEYDYLVNKFATSDGTVLVTDQAAWMIDKAPEKKTWLNKHIFYMETRKWLSGSFRHRVWFNIDNLLLHLNLWLIIAGIVYGAVTFNIIVGAAALLALLLTVIVRAVVGHKAAKAFGERIPFLAIYPYELSLVWHNVGYMLRHRFANKLDFTTHKQ